VAQAHGESANHRFFQSHAGHDPAATPEIEKAGKPVFQQPALEDANEVEARVEERTRDLASA